MTSNILRPLAVALCAMALCSTATAQARTSLLNRSGGTESDMEGIAPEPMPFSEAVEKAKGNDADALYALAFYAADGEDVPRDGTAAFRFLSMAAEAGNAKAVFLIHRLEEKNSRPKDFFTGFPLEVRLTISPARTFCR